MDRWISYLVTSHWIPGTFMYFYYLVNLHMLPKGYGIVDKNECGMC